MAPPVLIHLHVPKCAGASVNTALAGHFRPRVISPSHPKSKAKEIYLGMSKEQRDARFDCVFGHLFFGEHNRFNRPCVYISATRDPIERICSFFNFLHTRPDHHLHTYVKENLRDLNDFDDVHRDGRFKRQWDNYFFRAYGGQKAVRAAARGQLFAGSLEQVQIALRTMGVPEIPRRNVTDVHRFKDYVPAYADALSDRTLSALAPFCYRDYQLLDELEQYCTDGYEFAERAGLVRSLI